MRKAQFTLEITLSLHVEKIAAFQKVPSFFQSISIHNECATSSIIIIPFCAANSNILRVSLAAIQKVC
jgi:hypothetical protein